MIPNAHLFFFYSLEENHVLCPSCGKHDFTDIRQFNLMFKTFQGVTEDSKNTVYCPEAIHVCGFMRIAQSTPTL